MNWMNKKYIKTFILSEILCFLPVIIGIILYSKLPDKMAIHFDNSNSPDSYASKAFVVFCIPLLLMIVQGMVYIRYYIDEGKEKVGSRLFGIILYSTPVITIMVMLLTYMYALGYKINIGIVSLIVVGLFIFIAGNYIPKCHYIGFHIPWVTDEETLWNKTYRFSGWIYMLVGFFLILFSILSPPSYLWPFPWLTLIIVPFLYLLIRSFIKTNSKD